jgi:pyrroline-5-carboxylate reductase
MNSPATLPSIALLGFGTMGQVMATGLLRAGLTKPSDIHVGVRRPHHADMAAQALAKARSLTLETATEAAAKAEVVVLAVKPKDVDGLLALLREKGALDHHPLVISIAAGTSTAHLAAGIADCPIVRAMPNTPCAIGQGATVICRGPGAEAAHMDIARAIFTPLGAVLELDEKHMDTVTGLSGSGPAFIYLMLEAMAEGAVMQGLPRATALELAARVAQGAAAMVLASGRHPAALRDEVTTPAGCTAAGIFALEDGRIRSVLARGVETAAKRASELSR